MPENPSISNKDMHATKKEQKNSTFWMYASLPGALASGPLSTLITLYILKIGGGILNVAYAITLSSAITIPAVFLWGYVTDLLNKRKVLIVLSYLFTSFLIFSLFFIKNVAGATLVYAAIAFVGAASGAPLNLLVMETGEKDRWAHNFSILQMISGIGSTVGLLVAWVVTGVSTLNVLLIVLAGSALISAVLAAKLIKDPKKLGTSISLYDGAQAFVYRLVAMPGMIIKIPNPENIRNIFKFHGFASNEKRFVLVFYLISFIFFFSSAIFNTEYAVSLNFGGFSESLIFFLMLISMVVQTSIFYYYDRFTKSINNMVVSSISLLGRGSGYIFVGLFFVFFRGIAFIAGNFIFYILASGIAYAIYYPTSYAMLFKTLAGKRKGSTMGVYSAVIGVGTLAGALVSGGLAVAYGFGMTFIIAGGMTMLASYMFRFLPGI